MCNVARHFLPQFQFGASQGPYVSVKCTAVKYQSAVGSAQHYSQMC